MIRLPSRVTVVLLLMAGTAPVMRADEAGISQNTKPGVKYVGTQQCIDCHADQYESYLKTTHSVATTKTNQSSEPASEAFEHGLSGHRYEIDRRDSKLIHREVTRDTEGQKIAVAEEPIAFSVGSGTHGKSYLYRSGDFLAQSPLTWYRDTGSWHMSPGYDTPNHKSFRRKIASDCLFCHVGSIDQKLHNPYQFEVVETTIGCERCHGPGELHVQKWREHLGTEVTGDDPSIVNPEKLTRELSEAVCQQCHLQGASMATLSGKQQWDYRPGLPLTDFRIDYQYRLSDEKMRIVGHVEQMHESECYQQTETLTCTTCHDPHAPVSAEDRIEFYRTTCLKCHDDQACGKSLEERTRLAENNCYQCHMPKAETNVAHAAFHHHRIGIHAEDGKSADKQVKGLAPVLDVRSLEERERQRCAAIAKVNLIRKKTNIPDLETYAMDATGTLIQLKQAGQLDAVANSKLAWLAQAQGQRDIAETLAKETLALEPRPTLARIDAASILAAIAFQKGDKKRAAELYREVNQQDRDSYELYYLGLSENNVGNTAAAISALEESLKLDPLQVSAHAALRAIYHAKGNLAKSAFHERAARRNQTLMETLRKRQAGKQ